LIFDYFLKNLSRKSKFHFNWTRFTGTLREDQNTYLIISCSVLLRMRNDLDKSCTENQSVHFMFRNFFVPENSAVYEIMCNNTVQPDSPLMTIWCMHISCLVP